MAAHAHRRAAALAVGLAILSGAAVPLQAQGMPPAEGSLAWTPDGRGHGLKLLRKLDRTVAEERCAEQPLPFFRLQGSDSHPARLPAGESFSHRFSYVLCPAMGRTTYRARLAKRITAGTAVALQQENPDYELRPGTWADDDEIKVPKGAPAGTYTVVIEIRLEGRTYRSESPFVVE